MIVEIWKKPNGLRSVALSYNGRTEKQSRGRFAPKNNQFVTRYHHIFPCLSSLFFKETCLLLPSPSHSFSLTSQVRSSPHTHNMVPQCHVFWLCSVKYESKFQQFQTYNKYTDNQQTYLMMMTFIEVMSMVRPHQCMKPVTSRYRHKWINISWNGYD